MALPQTVIDLLNKSTWANYQAGIGTIINRAILDAAADAAEDTAWGNDLARMLEAKLDKKDLQEVMEFLDSQELVRKSDLTPIVSFLMALQASFGSPENLMSAINTLSNKIDELTATVAAL